MDGESHTHQVLAAALEYAARGWHVFPCRVDKRPYTRRGFKQASAKPKHIRKWWRRWPKASIGVACGASRLVVIDCDVKAVDGTANYTALGYESEAAWHSATPSGGIHYVFADTSRGLIRNSAGKLAAGVDVRAAGGYFIAPPSPGYRRLNSWSGTPADLPPNLA
ncbi:MAG: bifunctional DNA primase/polymerase, partial [Chloroflexi bacterium]|nr:bifunctional DNA primase/polymerase [Chloroflexota bacterium]